ncbi:hypothetical protein [Streptosporangium sp. NPDC003464]
MNDLEKLRETWARPAPPTPDAQAAARAALVARASRPRSRRGWAIRALAVAAAVIIATGVSVLQGERTQPAANAQVVLTRIAAAVQEKEYHGGHLTGAQRLLEGLGRRMPENQSWAVGALLPGRRYARARRDLGLS